MELQQFFQRFDASPVQSDKADTEAYESARRDKLTNNLRGSQISSKPTRKSAIQNFEECFAELNALHDKEGIIDDPILSGLS